MSDNRRPGLQHGYPDLPYAGENQDKESWSHNGKYLGKYLGVSSVGRPHDTDPELTFEYGKPLSGLFFAIFEN